jgi:isopenicillin N synthase-like dioxygenase
MGSLVPTVDVSEWSSPGGTDAREAIASAVDNACRTVGFLQVKGHGVADGVVDAALTASDAFFALPMEEKARYAAPSPEINRGYTPLGSESLAYSLGIERPADMFEAFNIGPDHIPDDEWHRARPMSFAANIWPGSQPEMATALTAYFAAARATADLMTRIFAVALGLPERFFEPFNDRTTETMRTIRYERAPGAPDPVDGQQRMGAHTDYGIVTVLYADPVPGLQIVGPDGAWHDVVPEPGCLLINLGDLLARWTNDRWRSTIHRVVPPPRDNAGPTLRRSIAFFLDGNEDAVIECLPTCTSEDNPPRYGTITAGEHLLAKLLGPRTATKTDVAGTVGDRIESVNL